MGYEIWFRGEGIGVAPSRPGGSLHDFGDGMYLTDSEGVARIYAQRRASSADAQRVWKVMLERQSLGNVLDLTADARWFRFMNAPMAKGVPNRLHFLKIKHELYDQFFREFLALHKIDIAAYDAVIGPEYNLGGRQLCILHKRGLVSNLAVRVRTLFRPLTSVVRWKTVTANSPSVPAVEVEVPTSARIRFLRGAAGFVASLGLAFLIAYLYSKIDPMNKILSKMMEEKIKALDPEIQASVEIQKRQIFHILATEAAGKAYVTVKIKAKRYEIWEEKESDSRIIPTGVDAELLWVDINDHKVEGQGKETVEPSMPPMVTWATVYTMSSEVTLPPEAVTQYTAAMEELKWYEDALRNPKLVTSDLERLKREKQALEEMIHKTYGDPLPEYAPGATRLTYEEFMAPQQKR